MVLPGFLIQPRNHLPVQGKYHPQWAGPSQTNHESRKLHRCSTGLPTDQSDRGIFSIDSNLCKQTNQDEMTLDIHTDYVDLLDKGVPTWGMVRC